MFRPVLVLLAFSVVLLGGIQTAEARRVRIQIESDPPGATVYVGSTDSAPLGTTPMDRVILDSGRHTLIFKKKNYETTKLNINVRRWRETFRAVLDPLASLEVSPVNSGAMGAELTVDGESKGQLPFSGTLKPGRHFLEVKKEGYQTYSQWHQLKGGEKASVPIMLEEEAPNTGSILVAGDRPGATIFLDGDAKGTTPTVIEDVPEGRHELEVRADGMEPFKKEVQIEAGKRINVSPEFGPQRGPEGSIRVLTRPSGAIVSIDGDEVGEAPVTKEGLPPGNHIVEAREEGFGTVQKEVTVEAGERKVVSLQLEEGQRKPGRIVVNATVDNAVVLVDGEDKGPPPVVVREAESGTHAIVVKATGYQDFRTTCEVGRGRDCEITARMEAEGTPIRVETNAPNAELYVDGERIGPVPFEGPIPAGSHRIEVRAPGHEPHVEQVMLQVSSETRSFNFELRPEGAKDAEELAAERDARRQATREAASYSAAPLPQDMTVIDGSLGWPYLVEARLGVGILKFLEAGFALRTFGRLTEFEGRAKVGWRPVRQLALGVQVRMGGGIGPSRDATAAESSDAGDHPTNNAFLALEALGTLHFSQAGAFTIWLAFDFNSDRWDFARDNKDALYTDIPGEGFDRQNQARVRIGGVLEILINEHWNVFTLVEGIVAPNEDRRIYGDIFGAGNDEFKLYLRGGFTYKFGLAREKGTTF